ncbi:proline dehydrogenase [Fusarium albosuccineum]|uniref:Proline dehydrogenase n=1 Tax=Fusarium albosuccineum TaxID=1237068 RepID=A0A8H4PD56_9HYPO|nr:proline dehydrogenase [Fusarium albosuccineum]
MSLRNVVSRQVKRPFSQSAIELQRQVAPAVAAQAHDVVQPSKTALSRLPNTTLVRSLVLTSLMSKNWLMRPSLALINIMTTSKSFLLNPDRNPVLNRLLRWTIYNQFCAGSTRTQVLQSMAGLRRLGYRGVILGFAKEVVLDPSAGAVHSSDAKYGPACYRMIEEWKQANFETIEMLSPGDFLSVKLTGAGPVCIDALQAHQPMPSAISEALDEICLKTKERGARLWIDAEQQILQVTLDEWVIELMKRHNHDGHALVYNTIQAYLKSARKNAQRHVVQAAREGWTVGIKLVRGAYIENEVRSLIHDTKEETDRSYNDLAAMIISRELPQTQESKGLQFPSTALMLATHNADSAEKAMALHRQRIADGLPTTKLECGQINGMADELSCALVESCEQSCSDASINKAVSPGVFKYVAWGSVSECMGYLYRRAVENRGAVERTQHMVDALKKELRRRVFG